MCYSKYSKRYGSGLRIAIALIVLLAVSLSPLAAWPTWLGGSEEQEQVDQMKDMLVDKELQIDSLKKSTEKLESQLDAVQEASKNYKGSTEELEKLSSDLKTQLEAAQQNVENKKSEIATLEKQLNELAKLSQESKNSDKVVEMRNEQLTEQVASLKANLSEAEDTVTTLKMELETLKRLSGLSEESYQNKVTSYVDLQQAYDEKVKEANELYEKAMGISGMLGSSILFSPADNQLGVEVEGGINFGDITAKIGADYMFPDPFSLPTNPSDLTYSAGVQFRF